MEEILEALRPLVVIAEFLEGVDPDQEFELIDSLILERVLDSGEQLGIAIPAGALHRAAEAFAKLELLKGALLVKASDLKLTAIDVHESATKIELLAEGLRGWKEDGQ